MDAGLNANANTEGNRKQRARSKEQSPAAFVDSLAEVLERSMAGRRQFGSPQLSALAYLIWSSDAIDFEQRICALSLLAESAPSNASDIGCVFSANRSLGGFLRAYCRQADLIHKEVFDSSHGIDFSWRLVEPGPIAYSLPMAGLNAMPFHSDDGYYGELDLCLEGALDAIRDCGGFSGTVIVEAQYWLCKAIRIELEFSSFGELLRVLQTQSEIDSCALLLSLLQVEIDEKKAYWRFVRRAKSKEYCSGGTEGVRCDAPETSALVQRRPINPLTDITGNCMLESKRDVYYRKYRGTIGAFSSASLRGLNKYLPNMQEVLAEALAMTFGLDQKHE